MTFGNSAAIRSASENGTKPVITVEAMNLTIRRVVVANTYGASRVVEEGEPPRSAVFTAPEGLAQSLVWRTEPVPSLNYYGSDPTTVMRSVLPQPGGTSLIVLTIPPDSAYADPSFDPVVAAAESAKHSPGLAELFESDNPGMHTTSTVDYDIKRQRRPSVREVHAIRGISFVINHGDAVVLEGELWLELTDGEVRLTAGDVVVQHGTRHAWRNRSDKPATLLAVLIGARDARSEDGR